MAILKKGSKGPEVRKLQEALNKNGFKLKVDGDFGKNTEDAVKKFQKTAKLKADGKVGPMTEAALKAGGPLPVMTVPDYTKRAARIKKARGINAQTMGDYAVISSILDSLDRAFLGEMEKASALLRSNDKHWDVVDKIVAEIIKLQKEFDAKRLSDPKAADKIARQCEAKHKLADSIGNGKISPNAQNANKHVVAAKSRLTKDTGTIDKLLGDIARRRDAF